MLFIHGGGFVGGSAGNNPPDLFINKDVILVTINYRLGVFGKYCFGTYALYMIIIHRFHLDSR